MCVEYSKHSEILPGDWSVSQSLPSLTANVIISSPYIGFLVCLSVSKFGGKCNYISRNCHDTCWSHQIETLSALLARSPKKSPHPHPPPTPHPTPTPTPPHPHPHPTPPYTPHTHKGQWRGVLMFSLICAWTNGCANNRDAGDLRRYRAHYYVTVMRLDMIQGRMGKTVWSVCDPCCGGLVITIWISDCFSIISRGGMRGGVCKRHYENMVVGRFSVSNIKNKHMNGFTWIFGIVRTWCKKQ